MSSQLYLGPITLPSSGTVTLKYAPVIDGVLGDVVTVTFTISASGTGPAIKHPNGTPGGTLKHPNGTAAGVIKKNVGGSWQ